MSTYPKYKPVTFEYVKQIPEDWQLLPNIAIFEERNEKGHINEELLSVTIGKGVIKQSDLNKKDSSNPDKSNYKLVEIGDVVYSMRFRQGASGYSNYKGLVSNACTVLKPKMEINPKFFHYQYRLPFFQNYAERYSYGIADGQKPLRWQDFKRMYAFVPPIETQNLIVAYLEEKEKQIKQFIKKKKELIIASEQQLFSKIEETIKPKCDDWLEKPLKHFVKINRLTIKDSINPNTEIKYIDIGSVTFNGLQSKPEKMKFINSPSRARRVISDGDTIISTVRTYLKAVAYIEKSEKNLICSTGFAVLTPNKKEINPLLLKYLVTSSRFLAEVEKHSIGISYPSISTPNLGSIKINVPKDLNLQKEITYKIRKYIEQFEMVSKRIEKELILSEDLLTSLTEQLIKGKISATSKYRHNTGIAAEPATTYKTL